MLFFVERITQMHCFIKNSSSVMTEDSWATRVGLKKKEIKLMRKKKTEKRREKKRYSHVITPFEAFEDKSEGEETKNGAQKDNSIFWLYFSSLILTIKKQNNNNNKLEKKKFED